MHALYERAASMTHGVIGAAIEVHKEIGPGLLESVYEWCLTKELELRGSFRFHEEFPLAVEMMAKGLIDVKPLITHTIDFDDAIAAFEMAGDRSRVMKAQIAFS